MDKSVFVVGQMSDREHLIDEACRLIDEGRFSAAVKTLKAVVGEDPQHAFAWMLLGVSRGKLGQARAASVCFQHAIQHWPPDNRSGRARVHRLLGATLRRLGQVPAAEREFLTSLELDPSGGRIGSGLIQLGSCQVFQGREEDALKTWRQAVDLHPESEEALYNLSTLVEKTDRAEAIVLLRNAIALDPEYSLAYGQLAFLVSLEGNIEEGEALARRAIELDPGNLWAYVYLAAGLVKQARLEEAKEYLARASKVDPESSVPYWQLGDILCQEGRLSEAELLFSKSCRLDPRDPVAQEKLRELVRKRESKQRRG